MNRIDDIIVFHTLTKDNLKDIINIMLKELNDAIKDRNIVINLNYNISKKILPFIKQDVEEMFLTQMEFENNEWIIVDVQKFTLE